MTNLEKIKGMPIDELAEWLDKNGQFDTAPWSEWFRKKYCDNCESIKCTFVVAKEKLDITPFYDSTIECAYCELADESGVRKCRFFPEFDKVPNNKATIKMWLEEEVEQ